MFFQTKCFCWWHGVGQWFWHCQWTSWILNNWAVKTLEAVCQELSIMACRRREGKSWFFSQFWNSSHKGGCRRADCRQNKGSSCWAEMATKAPVLFPAAESQVQWLLPGDTVLILPLPACCDTNTAQQHLENTATMVPLPGHIKPCLSEARGKQESCLETAQGDKGLSLIFPEMGFLHSTLNRETFLPPVVCQLESARPAALHCPRHKNPVLQ